MSLIHVSPYIFQYLERGIVIVSVVERAPFGNHAVVPSPPSPLCRGCLRERARAGEHNEDFTTSMSSDSSVFTACNVSRKSVPNDAPVEMQPRGKTSAPRTRKERRVWEGERTIRDRIAFVGRDLSTSDDQSDRCDYLFGGQGAKGIARAGESNARYEAFL